MSVPTTKFTVLLNNGDLITSTATPALRRAAITGEVTKSTGGGNEVDFGSVDITGGPADSDLWHTTFRVLTNGSNTTVDNVRLWVSTEGLDQALSVGRFRALSGSDETTATNTQNIKATNPVIIADYTFADMDTADSGAGTNNMWSPGPSDDVTSMDITTIGSTDDMYLWVFYIHVDSGETLGTYSGLTASFELQFSFLYEYT